MNENNVPLIIAEAGVNHNGDLQRAMEMVRTACECGADYVKFQTFRPEALVTATASKAAYQQRATGTDGGQMEMLRQLALTDEDFRRLAHECRRVGIGFMSTPFDAESIRLLAAIGQDYWKVPSGEIDNVPYLRTIGSQGGRVIMSTGMSGLADVAFALDMLAQAGTPRSHVILLHCNTQYPTPFADVNLRAMEALRTLGCAGVGYSDHTLGITVPVAATALGACVIEKHFTLDRSLPGPDHQASLDPLQLRQMVQAVHEAAEALGSKEKAVTASERPNIAIARRSIVAKRPIRRGEAFTDDNITVKRPVGGLSPRQWDEVIGQRACRDFDTDQFITLQ